MLLVAIVALVCAATAMLCGIGCLYAFIGFSGEGQLIFAAIVLVVCGVTGMVIGVRAANVFFDP